MSQFYNAGFVCPTPWLRGGAAFDPIDISSLSEWFDYRVNGALASGDPVGSWAGKKNVYTLTASGTSRPTWTADDGDGRPAILLDGVNDALACGILNSVLFGTTGSFEFIFVAKLSSVQNNLGGYFSSTGITNQIGASAYQDTSLVFSMGGSSYFGVALWDNTWHVIRCKKDGSRRVVEIDGSVVYDNTTIAGPYGTGLDTLAIGEYFGQRMTGSFRHWMAFTEPLDDATAAALTTYLTTA